MKTLSLIITTLTIALCFVALDTIIVAGEVDRQGIEASKPLFRDPVYDGAADPVLVWNYAEEQWFMFYTNRRANLPSDEVDGVTWVHGTHIGIAESKEGANWSYRGIAQIDLPEQFGGEESTHWAPEVIEHEGTYHKYLTVVPGIFSNWNHPRDIVHLTSDDLIHWEYQSTLELSADRVIDACVFRMPDGVWRMWYNNERDRKSIYLAESDNLYAWEDRGKVESVGDRPGEGPKVFHWEGYYWMIVDVWNGLGVYRSEDALHWTRQEHNLLEEPGQGEDDQVKGGHADVLVNDGRAYIFYFTHPGRRGPEFAGGGAGAANDTYEHRRSSIQVVELEYRDGELFADRDRPTYIQLQPPK